MSFNQFNYWRKGQTTSKPKLKKVPFGENEHLILYRIRNGEFNESPYLQMVEENNQLFKHEQVEWKQKNKLASKEAFEDWFIVRRAKWNKENRKLAEAHCQHELKLLHELELELNRAFKFDVSPFDFQTFEGSMEDLYWAYKNEISKLIPL